MQIFYGDTALLEVSRKLEDVGDGERVRSIDYWTVHPLRKPTATVVRDAISHNEPALTVALACLLHIAPDTLSANEMLTEEHNRRYIGYFPSLERFAAWCVSTEDFPGSIAAASTEDARFLQIFSHTEVVPSVDGLHFYWVD